MRTIMMGMALLAAAGCASAEDKANAKRKAELDLAQAELIVDGDCAATDKALDAWYDKNKAEADALDAWWKEKTDSDKDSLMADHKDMRAATHRKTLAATVKCGFVPMNSRRRP